MHCVWQKMVGGTYPSNFNASLFKCAFLAIVPCRCSCQVEPFLVLVKPLPLSSLDPAKSLAVVLDAVLVVTNDERLISLGDPTHASSASSSVNICCCCCWESADARCAGAIAVLIDIVWKQLGGSINKPPPIVESMPPSQLSSGRARKSHYLQCVPPRCRLRFNFKLCFFRWFPPLASYSINL